jgi:hypothetical protein
MQIENAISRVASNLENLEKLGNPKPAWKTWKSQGISLVVMENVC